MTIARRIPKPPPKWMPAVGTTVTAYLPNEMVRAVVEKHIDNDTIQARLSLQAPLAKAHNYRFKQLVTLHRERNEPVGERWASAED
jgi:hypothetical protein